MILDPGSIIGSYRVIRPLGEGGMGAVYEVEHMELGVRYALKTYTLADEHAELFRKRFAVEGRLLARLSHPNLVRVIDLAGDAERGIIYYVMDLVLYKDGLAHTLADLEPGGADEDQLFDWFRQLCDALAYVHGEGVVHRDIKLNNILLAPDKHVVLSDFGISRVFDNELRGSVGSTRTMVSGATHGWALGTQGYMAPEIERGEEATPAADVYSLGVVFFKLLTGLWYEPNLAPGAGGATDAVKLLADFERPWRDVLPVMLNERPEDRPTDLRELPGYLEDEGEERQLQNLRSHMGGPRSVAAADGTEPVPPEVLQLPRENRWTEDDRSCSGEAGSLPYVGAASCRTRNGKVGAPSWRTIIKISISILILAVVAVAAWFFLRPSTSAPNFDSSAEDAYSIPEAVN